MNLNHHYFKSVLFYKPQGTLASKYKVNKYHKIPKISPGLTFLKGPFWGAYFWRDLYMEVLISEFYSNQVTHVDGFCSLKGSHKTLGM